ncbi:MAG: glycosyltransferase family 4 protein [Pseudomonadota bacterium]
MARVLMVSKPLQPPWDDSAKNLARDLVRFSERHEYRVMGLRGADAPSPRAVVEPVYKGTGTYTPSLGQNLRVLRRLFRPDDCDIYHFFFAPNPATSRAARLVRGLKKRKRLVHTICSAPATYEDIQRHMFAHRVVALSENTRQALLENGVPDVIRIPPAIDGSTKVGPEEKRAVREELGLPPDLPLVLYAGDYQFSSAADTCARALPELLAGSDAHFVFACRKKQELSRLEEKRIQTWVQEHGLADRVHFFNELERIHHLVAAAAVQVLPAESLYAKMDIPLVLLESLREEVPVVIADILPLAELLERPVGLAIPPEAPRQLAEAVLELLGSPDRRRDMGREGRALVRRVYDAPVVAAAYERLYDELLMEG